MLYGKCSSYKDNQLCAVTTPWEHQIHPTVSCCDMTQLGLQTKVLEPAQLAGRCLVVSNPLFIWTPVTVCVICALVYQALAGLGLHDHLRDGAP